MATVGTGGVAREAGMGTTRALVVFHGRGAVGLARFLKSSFRHIFCALACVGHWLVADARDGRPRLGVAAPANFDLAGFYRAHGLTVIETYVCERAARGPVMPATCAAATKRLLGVRDWSLTPWQLYRQLSKETRSMGSMFSPPAPPAPPAAPPTPLPQRDDAELLRRRREDELALRRRSGRRATILTGGLGDDAAAPVERKTLLGS